MGNGRTLCGIGRHTAATRPKLCKFNDFRRHWAIAPGPRHLSCIISLGLSRPLNRSSSGKETGVVRSRSEQRWKATARGLWVAVAFFSMVAIAAALVPRDNGARAERGGQPGTTGGSVQVEAAPD